MRQIDFDAGRVAVIAAAVMTAMSATVASAATYVTTLSGSQEVPANASTATGTGRLYVTPDGNRFAVRIDYAGVSAPLAAGHVHCCTAAGANTGVTVDFAPAALTSGTITRSFDLTNAGTYRAAFLNGAGGGTVAGARTAFLTGLDNGQAYFNLHNSVFPGGEIRGQLAAVVPEPASWAMLIAGFGLTGAALRRRRHAVA